VTRLATSFGGDNTFKYLTLRSTSVVILIITHIYRKGCVLFHSFSWFPRLCPFAKRGSFIVACTQHLSHHVHTNFPTEANTNIFQSLRTHFIHVCNTLSKIGYVENATRRTSDILLRPLVAQGHQMRAYNSCMRFPTHPTLSVVYQFPEQSGDKSCPQRFSRRRRSESWKAYARSAVAASKATV
jgi:hypothetical protein